MEFSTSVVENSWLSIYETRRIVTVSNGLVWGFGRFRFLAVDTWIVFRIVESIKLNRVTIIYTFNLVSN